MWNKEKPKAKFGDQSFKKKSYMPYIVAGLSLLFLILGVTVMMGGIFNLKGRQNDEINAEHPASLTDWAPSIEKLWFKPNRVPVDVVIKPADRIITQRDEICIMFTTQANNPSLIDPVYITILVDFRAYPSSGYVSIARDTFYCINPALEKGYHLITVQTSTTLTSSYEWAISVQ